MNATKKLLVGRRIVDFQARLFSDGRGGWAHDPVIVLDNGARLVFVTEETEGSEYGTAVVYHPADKEKKVMTDDIFIAVEQAMTKDEKDAFLDGFLRQNPHWKGAHVADILAELDNHDANLDVVEPLLEKHGAEVKEPRLLAAAARVVFWAFGGGVMPHDPWRSCQHLIARARWSPCNEVPLKLVQYVAEHPESPEWALNRPGGEAAEYRARPIRDASGALSVVFERRAKAT